MKQIKLSAAVLGMLMALSIGARAQTQNKSDEKTQKMTPAFERLKESMSKGGTECVAGAGESVFSSLGEFSQASRGDNAVRAPLSSQAPRKSGLIKAAADDCWEVCVSWGPLHVCYTWEKRCR